jgi:hypothetical protein
MGEGIAKSPLGALGGILALWDSQIWEEEVN